MKTAMIVTTALAAIVLGTAWCEVRAELAEAEQAALEARRARIAAEAHGLAVDLLIGIYAASQGRAKACDAERLRERIERLMRDAAEVFPKSEIGDTK